MRAWTGPGVEMSVGGVRAVWLDGVMGRIHFVGVGRWGEEGKRRGRTV